MTRKDLGLAPSVGVSLLRLQDLGLSSDAWTDYVPTLTQGVTVAKTTEYARYAQIGRLVIVQVSLVASSAGTAANTILIGLPSGLAPVAFRSLGGSGGVFDTSASTWYTGMPLDSGSAAFSIQASGVGSALGISAMSAALATGDIVTATVTYETTTSSGAAAFPSAGGWTSYVPVATQSGTVTATVTSATYTQVGRLVVGEVYLSLTGAGTGSNSVLVTLPVAAVAATQSNIGAGWIYDVSVPQVYAGAAILNDATHVALEINGGNGAAAGAASSGFTAALASGDQIRLSFAYQAASDGGVASSSAWTTFTPSVVQSTGVTYTGIAKYTQSGKTIHAQYDLSITSAGTASQPIQVTLPVPSKTTGFECIGTGRIVDASASVGYVGAALQYGSNTLVGLFTNASGVAIGLGGGMTAALASGDGVSFSLTYEAA